MRTITALLVLSLAAPLAAADRDIAREYLRARCDTLNEASTEKDVERALAFLADDVVIEHPRFGAVVNGKDAVRRGITSHLSDYTGTREESGVVLLDVLDEVPGVVAMKTRVTFFTGEGEAKKKNAREGLMVFEIRDGRIRRMIEY